MDAVSRARRRFVVGPDKTIDRLAYPLCMLHRLQDGLRRREVFVDRSERWGNPRAKLLHGAAWETARSQVCLSLGRQATAACLIRLAAPAMPSLSAISFASFPLLVRNRIVDVLQRRHEAQFSSPELPLEDADIFPSVIRRTAGRNSKQIIMFATERFRLSHDLEMQ